MKIRQAQERDHAAIYELVRAAFATAKVSDGTEQDFVRALRRRDTYRPELEPAAEENGQLIGHILLTELPVPGAPENLRALMVAPPVRPAGESEPGPGRPAAPGGWPPGGGAGVQRPVSGG